MGLELKWMEWANRWWSSPFLDQVIPWFTHLGSHITAVVFILVSWILTGRRRVFGRLALLYGIQSAILYGLKFLTRRQRPLVFLDMTSRLSKGPGEILDPGFPSGHALYAFMMATLLSSWFPRFRFIFSGAAGFIGWTRLYLGLHYPTDVMVGALLGYGVTRLFLSRSPVADEFRH